MPPRKIATGRKAEEFKARTRTFTLRVIRLSRALPKSREGRVIADQILRSGTSAGANYRAVCRARSKAEFIAKVGICLEEADETAYWLELIADAELLPTSRIRPLLCEADELSAIFNRSRSTARIQRDSPPGNPQSAINNRAPYPSSFG